MAVIEISTTHSLKEEVVKGTWIGTESSATATVEGINPQQELKDLKNWVVLSTNIAHQEKVDALKNRQEPPQLNVSSSGSIPATQQSIGSYPTNHVPQHVHVKAPQSQHNQEAPMGKTLLRNGAVVALTQLTFDNYDLKNIKSRVFNDTGHKIQWDGENKWFKECKYWFFWAGKDRPLPEELLKYA